MIALDSGDKLRADASVANKIDYTIHGMVNDAIAQLSDGQIAAAEADVYTAPSDHTIVTTIILVNTHTSAVTCNLYLKPDGGTSRRIIPQDMSLNAGCILNYNGVHLTITDESGNVVYYDEGDVVATPSGYVMFAKQSDNTLSPPLVDASRHTYVREDNSAQILDELGHILEPIGNESASPTVGILVQGDNGSTHKNIAVDADGNIQTDVVAHPADTFVAEEGALGKGVLLQGDDGVDRHNVAVDAGGNVQADIVGALPAGANKIGTADIGKLDKTWTCISVNISTATTTELKAASAGHTYTVITLSLTVAAENNLTWKSASTGISGPMDFGKTGEPHGWQANLWPCGLKCAVGEALNLTTTTTGQVSGFICVLDES